MKSALFVDFDNVYSGLRRLDPLYAEAFAASPMQWLDWITSQLQIPLEPASTDKRRVLVRRCYLNPVMYQKYRFGFSKAGFEIVDCPPMTAAGKTSTDIHMVLDMVDVLQAETRYDEFIVFSADADFTPVLRKLRRDDRRTTIFAAGATSAAYDASSDLIIAPDVFISQALGLADREAGRDISPDFDGLLAQAEAVTWDVMEKAQAPVPLPALTKALAQRVAGLTDSNWAGRGTFTALLRELALNPLQIDRELNCLVDPRRLRTEPQAALRAKPATSPANGSAEQLLQMRAQVEAALVEEVGLSVRPMPIARLAHLVRQRCPGIEQDWLGAGTFKKLLETLRPSHVQVSWSQLGGYAFDPKRHSLDFIAQASHAAKAKPDADPRWPQVGPLLQAAGFPPLSGHHYRALLETLSQTLRQGEFSLAGSTAQVHDLCFDMKTPIAKADIYAFLRALLFNGFEPKIGELSFEDLIAATCGVASAACIREGVALGDADREALIDWVTSRHIPPLAEARASPDLKRQLRPG